MREGERLILTCNIIAGLPKPQVSWYKNKMLLADEESTNLILEELTDKDEGQYKCEARNPGGVADAIMNVMVDGKSREVLASFCLPTFMNGRIEPSCKICFFCGGSPTRALLTSAFFRN